MDQASTEWIRLPLSRSGFECVDQSINGAIDYIILDQMMPIAMIRDLIEIIAFCMCNARSFAIILCS